MDDACGLDDHTWETNVIDVVKFGVSGDYYFLVMATTYDSTFAVSAVFRADFSVDPSKWLCEIKPTYAPWVGMVCDAAGADLLLTGAWNGHDEWKAGKLLRKDALHTSGRELHWRSGQLWKKNADSAYYSYSASEYLGVTDDGRVCSKKTSGIAGIGSASNTVDALPISYVGPIHGYGGHFMVACGDRGYDDNFMIGGDRGVVFVKRNGTWSQVKDVPTIKRWFTCVYCQNETSIYFAAGEGMALHWDGGSNWINYDIEDDVFAYNIAEYQGQVYLASLNGKTYKLVGNAAIPVEECKAALRVQSAGGYLFGLGLGTIEMFDGQAWKTHSIDLFKMFPNELEALLDENASI